MIKKLHITMVHITHCSTSFSWIVTRNHRSVVQTVGFCRGFSVMRISLTLVVEPLTELKDACLDPMPRLWTAGRDTKGQVRMGQSDMRQLSLSLSNPGKWDFSFSFFLQYRNMNINPELWGVMFITQKTAIQKLKHFYDCLEYHWRKQRMNITND